MSKVSNCLLMLRLLNNGRRMNVAELAEILEVSPRMVRTYKQDLELAGFYIESINGKYGGYVYKDNDTDFINKFSLLDLQSLEGLYSKINNRKDFTNHEQLHLLNTIEKLRTILIFNNPTEVKSYDKNALNQYLNAIDNKKEIKIYYNKDEKNSFRNILPQNLYFYNNDCFHGINVV